MAGIQSEQRPARRPKVRRVAFDRAKYGRDLLVDIAWVHDMPAFILDAPHSLDFFDIILVTRGRGSFLLDGVPHEMRRGQVFFSAPGRVRLWNVTGLDGICLFFVDAFVREFLQDATFVDRLPFFRADPARAALQLGPPAVRQLRARLSRMRDELATFRRDSVDLLRAQLHETLLVLARDYAVDHDVAPSRAVHPTVARFLALVERYATERHRVEEYASELAVTPGYLSVLCAQATGMTAKRYIESAVTIRARRLLLYTDEPAARIAAKLGFDDPSYFARFFRRESGQSPSKFRAASKR
ncbi:MAG TPA: AraC family transcriptional regulator [Gemmatimonadaceae bacterium]|jgi:AraC-like DNA-binding protein|nr:AraC family transcriptional regulator [Gemmatimonadaceae bacterium]